MCAACLERLTACLNTLVGMCLRPVTLADSPRSKSGNFLTIWAKKLGSNDKVLWKVAENDLPGISIGFAAGLCVLDNGNVVFANWGGHGHQAGAPVVEFNPATRSVVWTLPTCDKNTVSNVKILDGMIGNIPGYGC